jgi:hypothetical protein
MQASAAFDLPCPWVPLQSMTAAASRLTPGRPLPAAFLRGQGGRAVLVFQSRSRLRRTPEGVWCGSRRPKLRGSGVRPVSALIGPLARSRCATGAGAASCRAAETARSRRRTESDDDFPGFGPFRRFDSGDRCAGLPHRHLPLSGFLTLSAVSSRPGLVALFHATSAPRVSVFRAFPVRPAVAPFGVLCSPAVPASWGRPE